jgi:hypothetical protein
MNGIRYVSLAESISSLLLHCARVRFTMESSQPPR